MFPLTPVIAWPRPVIVFVIGVGLLHIGAGAGRIGLCTAAAASGVVAVLVLLAWRGAPLLTLAIGAVRPRTTSVAELLPAAADHRHTFDAGKVGIRSIGTCLVAVVAVDGQPHTPSVLDRRRVKSASTLTVGVLARRLRQFDVALDGIDIVSAGVRRAPKTHHHHAPVYSGRVGDHPAVGQRRTWLVVRLDAINAVGAIMCRESVAATLAAAAQRIATDLTGLRCPARVLSVAEIAHADKALLAGVEVTSVRRGHGRLRHDGGYVHTYWVSLRDISSSTIDRLWAPDTDATVVAVQLRPASDGGTSVGVIVRYHTGGPLREAPLTGLNPLTGRHDLGLTASLATPIETLTAPARTMLDSEDLVTPIAATGIIIGVTDAGHPLLIDLANPREMAGVTIAGELALTVQVALRAAATGYQVLVHTGRPECWRQATAAGLTLVGEEGLGEELPVGPRPWMVVFDEMTGPIPDGVAVTVRTVSADTGGADVHLDQDGDASLTVRTRALTARVRIDLEHERHLTALDELGEHAAA